MRARRFIRLVFLRGIRGRAEGTWYPCRHHVIEAKQSDETNKREGMRVASLLLPPPPPPSIPRPVQCLRSPLAEQSLTWFFPRAPKLGRENRTRRADRNCGCESHSATPRNTLKITFFRAFPSGRTKSGASMDSDEFEESDGRPIRKPLIPPSRDFAGTPRIREVCFPREQ